MLQGTLVSFPIANEQFPGQVITLSPKGDVVHIHCLESHSKYQGKEFLRYVDDVTTLRKIEHFLLLGIDRETELAYDVDVNQKALLEKIPVGATRFREFGLGSKTYKGQERVKDDMIIKKSAVPVLFRGRGAGGPMVSVRENGQIAFSTESAKAFVGKTHVIIDFDTEKRIMTFQAADPTKPPKGMTVEDLYTLTVSKNEQIYLNVGSILQYEGVDYDYKACGTHSFPATVDLNKNRVQFELPVKMEPKPKTERKPRAKKSEANANATPVVNSVPAKVEVTEDELTLQ